MKNVGHNEEITQQRVIKLLSTELGYLYLGYFIDRAYN
jgi:type I restriction enzyme R subunit